MKNKLKELRKIKKVTQANMAEFFNIDQTTWSSWETGRTLPKPFQMQKLEEYFKVPKEKIFFKAFDYKM